MSRISPQEEDGQDVRCLALQVWCSSPRMMATETTTEAKTLIVTSAPQISENDN